MTSQISCSRVGQLDEFGPPAHMHVGARLALGGNAVEPGHRLAIDQNDALVALAHLGQIALDHEGLAKIGR